jgi:hypothetical protein
MLTCDLLTLTWGHTADLASEGIPSPPSLTHRRRPICLRHAKLFPQGFPP